MGWLQMVAVNTKNVEKSHILVYGCSILGSYSHVFCKKLTCSASGMDSCPPEAVSRQECLGPVVRFSLKSSPLRSLPSASLAPLGASKSHNFQGLSQVGDARTMKEILVDLRVHGS